MRPLTIAVDVDEVCAQLHREWIMRYNAAYNDTLTVDDFTCWDIETLVKEECGTKIFDFLGAPDFYRYVAPFPDAVKGINFMRDRGHRVVFLTSCGKDTMGQKVEWLERWGFLPESKKPHHDFIAAHDKSLIQADVLLDDAMHNVRAWHYSAILITRPHNVNEAWPLRASGILEAARLIDRWHPMAIRLHA